MKLTMSSSPHIRAKGNTSRIMLDVVIALIPALAVGVGQFGLRALLIAVISLVFALAGEWLYRLLTRQHNTLPDGSAAVTGLLLALTLPPNSPYWIPAVGALFAVIVVKGLSGGLGKNLFNPALGARAFLMLLFPVHLTRFSAPATGLPLGGADVVTAATPLHHMQMPALPEESLLRMFLCTPAGSIGEISTLALLAGGAYLLLRKVIRPGIPLSYLGTVALLSLIFYKGESPLLWMAYSLLSGGVVFGAIFMATDYTTSPMTGKAQLLFGAGCGLLTVFFRYFGLFPEGVTYAILLMNGLVPLMDEHLLPVRFGEGRRNVS